MIRFDKKYDHDEFCDFLKAFLPGDYSEKEKDIVEVNKCKVITKAKELGYSKSLDVYVLEMTHTRNTDPRVTIATDAFRILANYGIDKALVIFKNDDSENYRFSYLTISLDLNETNKVVRKYSNARRYSFYLGVGAKTKTPEQQLIKRGRVTDTADLLNRFSLEVVNKKFYLEIARLFDELVDADKQNLVIPSSIDANVHKDFAMRLIGRLMFCWFLKQKKSQTSQLIPDELLSSGAVKENYYHSILEALFFEVLNTQIEQRDIRNNLYDQVPYLNGGLFSPQYDDYYELDRVTFVSRYINTLRVSDKWLKEFLALLETYNFTIDENTVFDQELSVDPEMLGRIFENLLADINPETGSSERKKTGSFYTPRQIVEYMVDQSLLEYLHAKTDIEANKLKSLVSYDLNDDAENPLREDEKQKVIEAIESLKVLDPACGSGAFPIGVLQKIVWILQQADPDCKLWLQQKLLGVPDLYKQKIINEVKSNPFDYTRKLDVIKSSIFGVDIQPIAVEISRLRCFLTLVVESEVDDYKPNRNIDPLPNLDFKFVCANTLIGLPKSESNGLFEDHSGIEELSSIMSEYFSCSNQRKNEIRLRFTNAQKEILNKSLSNFGRSTGELTMKLSLWQPFENKTNPWFDPEWMFGVNGKFDIVIANPPYIDSEGMVKSGQSDLRDLIQSSYSWTKGNWDIYIAFFEFGFKHLNVNGLLTFITPDKWISKPFGAELRKGLIQHFGSILKSGREVFDSAKVDSIVTLISKQIRSDIHVLDYDGKEIRLKQKILKSNIKPPFRLDYLFSEHLELLRKLDGFSNRLEDIAICENSCATSDAYKLKPLIQDYTADSVNCDEYLKIINTGTIGKYHSRWGQKQMTYLKDKYQRPVVSRAEFLSTFPNSYGKKAIKQKIILKGLNLLDAYLDENGCTVPGKTTLVVLGDNGRTLKLLLGIINSKLTIFYIKEKYPASSYNQGISFTKDMINELPLPILDDAKIAKLTDLVTSIIKKSKSGSDTKGLETEVDDFLFELYGLTEEEKEIVQNS